MAGRSEKSHKARNAAIGGVAGHAFGNYPMASLNGMGQHTIGTVQGEGHVKSVVRGLKGAAAVYDPRLAGEFPGRYHAMLGATAAAGAGIGALKGRKKNSNIPDGAKRGKRL